MQQKATITLDHQYQDAKGKALPNPITSLTIEGELLPETPVAHHIAAALLDKKNPPQVKVNFKNDKNVLSYTLTFTHSRDVIAEGKAEHDLHVEAGNRGMSVEALREEKKQQAETAAE